MKTYTEGFIPPKGFIDAYNKLVAIADSRNIEVRCCASMGNNGVTFKDVDGDGYYSESFVSWEELSKTDAERMAEIQERFRVHLEREANRKMEAKKLATEKKEEKEKRDYARLKAKFENQSPA